MQGCHYLVDSEAILGRGREFHHFVLAIHGPGFANTQAWIIQKPSIFLIFLLSSFKEEYLY